jgi:RNA polymerase sigma-70 factor (ECF subfamily)
MIDFQTLYERHANDVFRFAFYLCANRSDAEDITSETFVRAWTVQERIELPTVKSYLFAIARNYYLQSLRKRSRQRDLAEIEQLAIDPSPGPEVAAEQKMELNRILTALQELPEADRSALLLRAQEGLSYLEIARTLGLSEAAVKIKIHRTRLKLWNIRGFLEAAK